MRTFCTDSKWLEKAVVSLSIVPGSPRPGESIGYRLNGWNLNHFEARPVITFTDAATGEETVMHLEDKATEPEERQRLTWTFTVPSEGTVTYYFDDVVYCVGNDTQHGDGQSRPRSFGVRAQHDTGV